MPAYNEAQKKQTFSMGAAEIDTVHDDLCVESMSMRSQG